MMRRVVERESSAKPTLIELFKGTDLRRTIIVSGIYAAQNLAGNLISNQSVFFFERRHHLRTPGYDKLITRLEAGMSTPTAFALGLVTSVLDPNNVFR
jgi:SP family general alpha glucoside:H+ symporter-like MFS transporter